MTTTELVSHLVQTLQQFRDNTPDEEWDELDGTPLMNALDGLADLEFEVEEHNYKGWVTLSVVS